VNGYDSCFVTSLKDRTATLSALRINIIQHNGFINRTRFVRVLLRLLHVLVAANSKLRFALHVSDISVVLGV
jgi:hypothetical protein